MVTTNRPEAADKALAASFQQARSRVFARQGMVATAHPLATGAGLDALRRGGNAMDAAVAYLVSLGHVRLARVSGLDDLSHVQIRDRAFLAAASAHGAAGQIQVAD